MSEPADGFGVSDVPLLVARSIRDRLRVLQEIDEADAPMKTVNKHTAREDRNEGVGSGKAKDRE